MCRLSLVDWLATNLGQNHRPLLYQAVFAFEPEGKEEIDTTLAKKNLWPQLKELLSRAAVLDPACGSGSFLVGMLLVLDDLIMRANQQLNLIEPPYERRKAIIGRSLYGVDVMPWIVHVAELRLWLQLVIETELDPYEAQLFPFLPNLSFKVRPGDSLVQEVGGVNLNLHQRGQLIIPAPLKARLTQLKNKKFNFFLGDAPGLSESSLKQEEFLLFREIMQSKIKDLQEEVKQITRRIEAPRPKQLVFTGMEKKEPKQLSLAPELLQQERDKKEEELVNLREALAALKEDMPFIWDLAFVEIFAGDKQGFDIVIGNPPYVRQEKIHDPKGTYDKQTYKAKLQESVAAAWPVFFNYQYKNGVAAFNKVNGRSDLYIYFYLYGLSLINPKGTFCFITSNSWLDVGYGRDLQEFLLKHSQVKLILDNKVKRSFSRADVNTVIVVLGAADDKHQAGLLKTARFVMFKTPFEEVLSPVIFEEIEETKSITNRPEFRCLAKSQKELYE
jgi:hypothetical protein